MKRFIDFNYRDADISLGSHSERDADSVWGLRPRALRSCARPVAPLNVESSATEVPRRVGLQDGCKRCYTGCMSNELDIRADQLMTIAAAISELRDAVKGMETYRDGLIRAMRREGYSAIRLAELGDLTRARVYQVIDAPPADSDDSEYFEYLERVEDAWQAAVESWAVAETPDTTPDDFFPLEALLERR